MVAVLCDVCHGCEGSIWYLTVQFQSPAILASIACCAPGVAAFIILSIIAFCSAVICGGASAASATLDTSMATMASVTGVFIDTSWLGRDRTNAAQASKVWGAGRFRWTVQARRVMLSPDRGSSTASRTRPGEGPP